MEIKGKVPLTIRISPEARKILERRAQSIVCDEDRLPLGRMIDAMILWFEDNTKWDEILLKIRADIAREAHERRIRDRERKRRKLGREEYARLKAPVTAVELTTEAAPKKKSVAETKAPITGSILGKIGRAYKKANMPNVTEKEKREFAQTLLDAGVPILKRGSGRLARVIRGEVDIEDLLKGVS